MVIEGLKRLGVIDYANCVLGCEDGILRAEQIRKAKDKIFKRPYNAGAFLWGYSLGC